MPIINPLPALFWVPYKITNKGLSLEEVGVLVVIMAISQGATEKEIDDAAPFFELRQVKLCIHRLVKKGIITLGGEGYRINL